MAAAESKVKLGLKNVHFVKYTGFDQTTNAPTYDTKVIPCKGAVSLSMSHEGDPENFFADDTAYYTINNNQGYSGDLEIALLPDEFKVEILNESLDSTDKVMMEDANSETNNFAMMFQFSTDAKERLIVFYHCSASRPDIEGETAKETKEPKTDKLTIKATPLENGKVKACTTEETSEAVRSAWFTKPYWPTV